MKRRQSWAVPLVLIGAGSVHAALAAGPAGFKVSARQLQQAVASRFPVRLPVAGLVDIDLLEPQLRLLPELNRLGATLVVRAGGPALRRSYGGLFDVDFLLRYEPSDQTIRAHRPRVHSLQFDGLPRRPSELLNAHGQLLAQEALDDVVLHQLEPKDLRLADSMGLRPDTITVTGEGLVVGFTPKTTRPP
jgi:hypothetical protein